MSENSALRTLLHFVAEDLGVADKWKDRNPVQLTTDIRKSIATRDARIAELEAALRVINALRRRIHFIEKHNQHFERCESAWCNPSPDEDPARECLDAVLAQARREALADYLHEAREFSERTFGAGRRTLGVTKHIEKEIAEVRAKPDDLTEWVDIIILACDGYWRHGGQPENLLADMLAKLAKNKARVWPKPTSEDEPVEHDRTHDPLNPELGPEHREFWVRRMAREVKP